MTNRKTGGRRAQRHQDSKYHPGPGHWDPSRKLRRSEAAEYLRDEWGIPISPRTLANLAVLGGGPIYLRCGLYVLYDIPDLDDYARSRIARRRSTTEIVEQRGVGT